MNEIENHPNATLARAHVCPECRGLGACRRAPGTRGACPASPAQAPSEGLTFTLPPEPPFTAAEHAEADRIVAEASAPAADQGAVLWAEVDVVADTLTIRRGTRVEFEVPLSLLRVYRHDDLVPRLVAAGCTGLLIGGAFGWFAPSIAMWLMGVGA